MGSDPKLEDMMWASLTDLHTKTPMGVTAENLAVKYELTREEVIFTNLQIYVKGTFIKDVQQFWAILDIYLRPTYPCLICFLYYAYHLSPIFAEIPTYPKIGSPL